MKTPSWMRGLAGALHVHPVCHDRVLCKALICSRLVLQPGVAAMPRGCFITVDLYSVSLLSQGVGVDQTYYQGRPIFIQQGKRPLCLCLYDFGFVQPRGQTIAQRLTIHLIAVQTVNGLLARNHSTNMPTVSQPSKCVIHNHRVGARYRKESCYNQCQDA